MTRVYRSSDELIIQKQSLSKRKTTKKDQRREHNQVSKPMIVYTGYFSKPSVDPALLTLCSGQRFGALTRLLLLLLTTRGGGGFFLVLPRSSNNCNDDSVTGLSSPYFNYFSSHFTFILSMLLLVDHYSMKRQKEQQSNLDNMLNTCRVKLQMANQGWVQALPVHNLHN